jgi:zinc/manganese transport system ATP-binding protein
MIAVHNLTVSYRQHPALHHVTGEFPTGSLTAVVGPNGSGKSTLLKTLAGLIRPAGGHVDCDVPRARLAYLPQLSEIDRSFPIQVRDCVMLGAWSQLGPWGRASAALNAKVQQAIDAVGLGGFERRAVGSLSAGQFQRVLFARAMVQEADAVLLDEPFTGMDSRTTATLLTHIDQWHAQGRTVIAVLHDDAQVRAHFERSVLLARECVAWGPTADVLTEVNLLRARNLAEAWDDDAAICHSDQNPAVQAP